MINMTKKGHFQTKGKSMNNGWTEERRARQREMIHTWRPWEKSTGPRTTEGKAVSARNNTDVWLRELKRRLAMRNV